MNIQKAVLLLSATGLISACGGSESSGTQFLGSVDQNAKIASISGVYDSSRSDDESYLYISSTGVVTAYDYQGDANGTGDNCYSIASSISQTNSSLNSGNVRYATTGVYILTSATNVLEFTYDTTNGMQNFVLDASISNATGIDIVSSNINIKVGGDGSLPSALLISDIEAAMCP